MQPRSVHPNYYKKITFCFSSYKKEKMSSLSTKKRIAVKEFNHELLNLVMMQYEIENLM